MISLYLAIGVTVYYYSGQYVASPALGSAGVLLKRVAYGVSLNDFRHRYSMLTALDLSDRTSCLDCHFGHLRTREFCPVERDETKMLTLSLEQLPAKWMFVRALQGTADLTKNTVKHWVYWLGSVFIVVVCGYILASAVPVFSGLLGVIGSLFCAFLCITLMVGAF